MTPYYQRDGITIFCGETLATMAQLTDPFDAIIADLPYGTTACSWDTVIPFKPLWEQYKRLTAGAVVLFGSEPFSSLLRVSNLKEYKYDWVWVKTKSSGHLDAKRKPMRKHENITVFCKSGWPAYYPQDLVDGIFKTGRVADMSNKVYSQYNNHGTSYKGNYPKTVIEFANPSGAGHLHPTQKPVDLLAYLIRTYTNAGEIVLDNTMGSGTTLVAAQREGRRAVGIDDKEEYCKIAVERLRQPTFWSIPAETAQAVKVEQATLL